MSVENSESSASAYHTQERKKSNLAFAFFCMEKDRAKDMEVLYAFCRLMDDIADDEGPAPEAKRATLDEWKREISSIYGKGCSFGSCLSIGWPFRSTIRRSWPA